MRFACNKLSSFLIRIEEMTNQLSNKDEYLNQLCDETQKSQNYILIKSRLTDLIIADLRYTSISVVGVNDLILLKK